MALSTSTLFMTRCSRPGWPRPSRAINRIASRGYRPDIRWPPRRPRRAARCRAICRLHRTLAFDRLALGDGRDLARNRRIEIDGADAGSDALPVAQSWPRLFDLDRQHAIASPPPSTLGDLAVIDRLDEARVDQPAFEERAAPFRHRQVHHIGHHVDAGDQPAARSRTVAPRCRRASCFRTAWRCCRPGRDRFRAGWSWRFP